MTEKHLFVEDDIIARNDLKEIKMEELKTLEDLRVLQKFKAVPHPTKIHGISLDGSRPSTHIHQSHVDLWSLRQLAIAHIKHMRREGRDLYNANIDEKSAIPKLMEIFNLNEEDLK